MNIGISLLHLYLRALFGVNHQNIITAYISKKIRVVELAGGNE